MSDDPHVFVVDDDADVRDSLRLLLEAAKLKVRVYALARQFLNEDGAKFGCLVSDVRMLDMTGLELQQEVVRRKLGLPVIIITGHGDVPLAVRAMQAGAIDFLEKPFDPERLLSAIRRALEIGGQVRNRQKEVQAAENLLAMLTPRERAVLDRLVKGSSNKVAAHELGISPRTVEIHRARIMDKLGASSLSDLVRMVLAIEDGSGGGRL